MNAPAVAFMVLVVVLIAGACVAEHIGNKRLRREERRARIMQACLRQRQYDAIQITSPVPSSPETVAGVAGDGTSCPSPALTGRNERQRP